MNSINRLSKKNIFLLGLGLSLSPTLTIAQEPPNIIFFLVDDLGWKDISRNGSEIYETPNIDEICNESVYFSNAYSSYPRCTPSRYSMITGRHPARDRQKAGNKIKHEETSIAEALKAHGYGTFFAGKWHIGKTEEFWPHNHGFDINKGGCDAGSPGSYFFPYGSETFKNHDLFGLENGEKGEYITDRLTDETIDYIRNNNDKPFLAYVSHYAVHTPLQAKADRVAYYEDKISNMKFEGEEYIFGPDGRWKQQQDNAVYAAMVESMDESFGRIIDELKSLGIYDNTIIIFTSDHGGLSNSGLENNRELATTNLPLRAGKGHIYEGGIKVPVFVKWKGNKIDLESTDALITGMDYFPSILEMCGFPQLPEAHLDGASFAPALKGETMDENRILTWHQVASRPESTGDHNSSVIRRGNLKLHHFLDDDKIELYDLSKDPYEENNIAADNPCSVKELLNLLNKWKVEVDAAE